MTSSSSRPRGTFSLTRPSPLHTGGSAEAAGTLIAAANAHLLAYLFILELGFLHGRDRLQAPVYTLLSGQDDAPT